ncbi:hypothetical protein GBAR_LOCUS1258 [Geodia barretti]|uniref:Uncharacterized protein n=1 Tax=Geodia barretti TaxID=519541 RepID=A0AA35W2F5_GEOBA|nr:hypothetical protein GBAR_LOCUS1258 [Geodia barretti]
MHQDLQHLRNSLPDIGQDTEGMRRNVSCTAGGNVVCVVTTIMRVRCHMTAGDGGGPSRHPECGSVQTDGCWECSRRDLLLFLQ